MPPTPQATTRKKPTRQAPSPVVEFTAAAHEHDEPMFDVTTQMDGAIHTLLGSPFEVPAFGFMRHILLEVIATGGADSGETVAGSADSPWSAIEEVTLEDVNGAPIFGPYNGYQLFLANVFGGYAFRGDPRFDPDYSAVVGGSGASGNFAFALRVPVEIQHNNGLGALANQNSAASYKLRVRLAASTSVYTVAPDTLPAVRIRGTLEAWSQPASSDLLGRPQATEPPRHGTTQYWSVNTFQVASGTAGPVKVQRVGNLFRTLILVNRLQSDGSRDTSSFPDPFQIQWDARMMTNEWRSTRRKYMSERAELITGGVPAGVFLFDFNHDVLGHLGDGTPELWIPTVQATRFEFQGTWTAAVNLEILVNDVAPVEVAPSERYVEDSKTGFTPDVGVPVR